VTGFGDKSKNNWVVSNLLEKDAENAPLFSNAATNRAYYSVYQAALYYILKSRGRQFLENLKLGEEKGSHQKIYDFLLRDKGLEDVVNIHQIMKMKVMKGLRKKADYSEQTVSLNRLRKEKNNVKPLQQALLTLGDCEND